MALPPDESLSKDETVLICVHCGIRTLYFRHMCAWTYLTPVVTPLG